MNAVPFDTLKMARGLEAAGFPPAQAAGVAATLADAMSGADLATKADIAELRTEMNSRFDAVQTEMNSRFDATQSEMNTRFDAVQTEMINRFGIAQAETNNRFDTAQMQQQSAHTSLRAELKADIAQVRGDMELLRRDLVIRLGGMIFLAAGMVIAVMRYLPPHP